MNEVTRRQLFELARRAARMAYCPYSHFHVGAALLGDDGFFVTGANVENASYGLTLCAERVAIAAAVAAGMRRLRALAVACVDSLPDAPQTTRMPCGACRQVIAEFATPQTEIFIDGVGQRTLEELLPGAFTLSSESRPIDRPKPWVCWQGDLPTEVPTGFSLRPTAGRCLALVTNEAALAEAAALRGMHAFHLGGPPSCFHHSVREPAEVWEILNALV